jgi:hypothetical protein
MNYFQILKITYFFFKFEVHAKTLYRESIQWLEVKDSDLNKEFYFPFICQLLATIFENQSETNMDLDEGAEGESKWRN